MTDMKQQQSSRVKLQLGQRETLFNYPILCFLAAFIIAGGKIMEEAVPFGAAFIGASGAGLGGICSLAGAVLGYGYFFGITDGIEYIAACVMIFTVAFVCQYIPVYKNKWFMPIMVAFIVGVTMAYGAVSSVRSDLPYILRILFEVMSGGVLTFLYARASFHRESMRRNQILQWCFSWAAILACVLLTLSRICVYEGLSAGRIIVHTLVLVGATIGGPAVSCCVGTGFGFVMDLSLLSNPLNNLIYGVSGLVTGLFNGKNRIILSLIYMLSISMLSVVFWDTEQAHFVWQETIIGVGLYILLPKNWLNRMSALLVVEQSNDGQRSVRLNIINNLHSFGTALTKLGSLMSVDAEDEQDQNALTYVYERASDAVCTTCSQKNMCWSNHYLDMMAILDASTPKVRARGSLCAEDLPEYFREYCKKHEQLIMAVNYELKRSYDSLRFEKEQVRHCAVTQRQIELLANINEDKASYLRRYYKSIPQIEQKVMQYFRVKGIVCTVAAFYDSNKRIHISIRAETQADLRRCDEALDRLSALLQIRLCSNGISNEQQTVLELFEAEPYAVVLGVAVRKKRGELVCGDFVRYFKTDEGILYVILSDGMGTGEPASVVSDMVSSTLESFLKSGVQPIQALELLNSAVYLRGTEDWSYATIDLLSIDLFTGRARIYKYGAAPTIISCRDSLVSLSAKTISLGMIAYPSYHPDVYEFDLEPGSVAIMTSDGVVVDDEDKLKTQIRETKSMKLLARQILMLSEQESAYGDDQTVVTVSFDRRK